MDVQDVVSRLIKGVQQETGLEEAETIYAVFCVA